MKSVEFWGEVSYVNTAPYDDGSQNIGPVRLAIGRFKFASHLFFDSFKGPQDEVLPDRFVRNVDDPASCWMWWLSRGGGTALSRAGNVCRAESELRKANEDDDGSASGKEVAAS